jgi:hypothetical protein
MEHYASPWISVIHASATRYVLCLVVDEIEHFPGLSLVLIHKLVRHNQA